MTFSASANPIVYQGATPVFIDSEPGSWNMCPEALKAAIKELRGAGKSVKAILPVHLYGMPANLSAIQEIAQRYELPILEDAAEALGSTYQGKGCGSFGDLGVLSFNGNKIITTSGGGALLGSDTSLIAKARFLATQARDQAPHYQHSHIGYNYRMSNVLAGIGRGQMEVLPERVAQRRANYERYRAYFATKNQQGYQVRFQEEAPGSFSNRWLTCILLDPAQNKGITREQVRLALEAENIESRPLWKPMHLQPVFASAPYFGGTVAETLFDQGLCLPSGSNLSSDDFERIWEVLNRVFVA
jgi:dTDP-4-amino-4,6-dideoxygalactose transaminase